MKTTLTNRPIESSLDQCIKCNICTTSCPVSAVTDLFPGPKFAGPQSERFRNQFQPSPDMSVDYCSGCRVCNMVCPTGVKIAELNARARARLVTSGNIPLIQKIRNNLIARPELLGKFGQPIAPVSNRLLDSKLIRRLIENTLKISHLAPLPKFSNYKFTTWLRNHQKPGYLWRKVVYFHGCSTQFYEPWVGKAAIQVLERNGFEVIVPKQNCCGLPLLSNGEFSAAKRNHLGNIHSLLPWVRQGYKVVGTSTSCILTLKEEAPDLLDMHDEDTLLLAENTYDINEFLLIIHEEGSLDLRFKPVNLTIPYHIPCQYRAHRIGNPGFDLLSLIPDLTIVLSDADCCGIAGTYGYKTEKYQIAMNVGQELFSFINNSGSELVICDSETCRWQIFHVTGKKTIHPIELLAYSYEINSLPEAET
jgi:glycerol-3-phosphate dehydrogenase subunit C